ncbi:MAG: peptidoglycan-associated lipoprotein Pal [Myxococcota bacterium]
MLKRTVTICVLAFGLACAGTASRPEGETGPGGGFGPEGAGTEPGMETRGGGSGVEPSELELRSIYFDFDDDSLKEEARSVLRRHARVLAESSDLRVEIQGNCDERGSEEYNLALGMRRAEAAKRYLVDLGIPGSRLTTISFGEENPVVRGHNEAAWAKNRRDDFKVR